MIVHPLHRWDISIAEATALQRQLAAQVQLRPARGPFQLVAGADISYSLYSSTLYAAVVVLRWPDMSVVEVRGAVHESTFPYQPGYLSFREAPPLLEAFARVQSDPDVVLFDGQGVAHPRRLGLACHVGLCLQKPAVGCAKSRLLGEFGEVPEEAGAWVPLVDRGEEVGRVLRTKRRVNPLFVSPGHLIDAEGAVAVALACCRGYRLPEPTRQAHLHVNALRRGEAAPS